MGLLHLYIDETGARMPDYSPVNPRNDQMDCFAFGGALLSAQDIKSVLDAHAAFSCRWSLKGPLHSTKIRGRRNHFSWLATDAAREAEFLNDLEKTILSLPIVGAACVVDRPGYVARYKERYREPWLLCKTAYAILIERAAKFAMARGSRLLILYEAAGEREDRDLVEYTKLLKTEGMPFDRESSASYGCLGPKEFREILSGEPQRITKQVPMVQFSDLLLYPIAKAGYEPEYPPHSKLKNAKRLLDCFVPQSEVASLGNKYSCFDRKK